MPSSPAKPFLVSRQDDPQLQLLNEKISKLAAVKPAGDVFSAFAVAAHLADMAIEAALELGQMPGVDMKALQLPCHFSPSSQLRLFMREELFQVLGNSFRHRLLILTAASLLVYRVGPQHLA